ncbi:MAG: preprotein translocase subunit SecG [Planctomycetaceae bacterium]|nr:preprotein translocase subunit SecG [Planctomycetaceae bacterium]
MYSFLSWFSQILLLLLGFFLIVVVLLQRGRGGGLAGAFGGTGGQSAFGTKAGDVFTKITIVIAILWVVVSGASGFAMRAAANQKASQFPESTTTTTIDPEVPTAPAETPAGKGADTATGADAAPADGAAADPAAPTGGAEAGATAAEPAATPGTGEPATATPPASGNGDASNQN